MSRAEPTLSQSDLAVAALRQASGLSPNGFLDLRRFGDARVLHIEPAEEDTTLVRSLLAEISIAYEAAAAKPRRLRTWAW